MGERLPSRGMAWGAGDLVGMEQALLAARGAVRWETGTEP